jgi:hypothetical protein
MNGDQSAAAGQTHGTWSTLPSAEHRPKDSERPTYDLPRLSSVLDNRLRPAMARMAAIATPFDSAGMPNLRPNHRHTWSPHLR